MLKEQPCINEPFNVTECPVWRGEKASGFSVLNCTVHFGMFSVINVWLCCPDNPCLIHNVPISIFCPLLVFMLEYKVWCIHPRNITFTVPEVGLWLTSLVQIAPLLMWSAKKGIQGFKEISFSIKYIVFPPHLDNHNKYNIHSLKGKIICEYKHIINL